MRTICATLVLGVAACGMIPAGCASAPKSSRLSVDDIEFTAKELAAKLADSRLLRERTAESPRMVVAIDKVENLSNDLIPESDQWYMMVRVRNSQSMESLRRLRNIVFVVPAEKARSGVTEFDREFTSGRRPTHVMSATYTSAVRTAGKDRTDAYMCELRMTDIDTREVVFADSVEFKKVAFGKAYD